MVQKVSTLTLREVEVPPHSSTMDDLDHATRRNTSTFPRQDIRVEPPQLSPDQKGRLRLADRRRTESNDRNGYDYVNLAIEKGLPENDLLNFFSFDAFGFRYFCQTLCGRYWREHFKQILCRRGVDAKILQSDYLCS